MLLRDRFTHRTFRRRTRPARRDLAVVGAPPPAGGDGDTTYVLVRDEAATTGGWTLLALHGRGPQWSVPLASRGAAPTAPARVAKAVALRVLHERGVDVAGWRGAGGDGAPMFRAALLGAPAPMH